MTEGMYRKIYSYRISLYKEFSQAGIRIGDWIFIRIEPKKVIIEKVE